MAMDLPSPFDLTKTDPLAANKSVVEEYLFAVIGAKGSGKSTFIELAAEPGFTIEHPPKLSMLATLFFIQDLSATNGRYRFS